MTTVPHSQQLEDALNRAGEDGTAPAHDDRALQKLRILRHAGDQLVVGNCGRVIQPELRDHWLTGPQEVTRPDVRFREQGTDLALG